MPARSCELGEDWSAHMKWIWWAGKQMHLYTSLVVKQSPLNLLPLVEGQLTRHASFRHKLRRKGSKSPDKVQMWMRVYAIRVSLWQGCLLMMERLITTTNWGKDSTRLVQVSCTWGTGYRMLSLILAIMCLIHDSTLRWSLTLAFHGHGDYWNRKRTCYINAGMTHNCDFKDLVSAMNARKFWESSSSPGKRRRRSILTEWTLITETMDWMDRILREVSHRLEKKNEVTFTDDVVK